VIQQSPSSRRCCLEQDRYERLLEELTASLKTLLVCGYHTGARKNELRRIRWDQRRSANRNGRRSEGG
jgi:integrase